MGWSGWDISRLATYFLNLEKKFTELEIYCVLELFRFCGNCFCNVGNRLLEFPKLETYLDRKFLRKLGEQVSGGENLKN